MEYQFDQAANRPRGTGDARLFIDGSLAAQARFQEAGAPLFGTFDIGAAHTSPVSSAYQLPFRFTGTLDQVRLEFMP